MNANILRKMLAKRNETWRKSWLERQNSELKRPESQDSKPNFDRAISTKGISSWKSDRRDFCGAEKWKKSMIPVAASKYLNPKERESYLTSGSLFWRRWRKSHCFFLLYSLTGWSWRKTELWQGHSRMRRLNKALLL